MENGIATLDIFNITVFVNLRVEHNGFLNLLTPSQFFVIFHFIE